jgi:hypothetical protein
MRIQEVTNAAGRRAVIDDRHATQLSCATIHVTGTKARVLRSASQPGARDIPFSRCTNSQGRSRWAATATSALAAQSGDTGRCRCHRTSFQQAMEDAMPGDGGGV